MFGLRYDMMACAIMGLNTDNDGGSCVVCNEIKWLGCNSSVSSWPIYRE